MGYCPQFDALVENLTVSETLQMFAMLRGVPTPEIKPICEMLINMMGLQSHVDKYICNLRHVNIITLTLTVTLTLTLESNG
jgi:ATP-binding cassette subfamily A (ABC1) protein 3